MSQAQVPCIPHQPGDVCPPVHEMRVQLAEMAYTLLLLQLDVRSLLTLEKERSARQQIGVAWRTCLVAAASAMAGGVITALVPLIFK